ncbi:MAG: NDP-sugar synthase [Sulfolobales archaeon]
MPIGGLGTRLYPLTVDTSKAMIRFLNKNLIDFIIMKLARQGIKEFYLGVSGYVNYVGLYDHLGSGEGLSYKLGFHDSEIRIRYQPNIESRGNAESVKLIMDYYDLREDLIIVQGDTLFDIILSDVWRFHKDRSAYMTIVLKELEDVSRLKHYGVADIKSDGRIVRFIEKPLTVSEAPSRLINTGIYIISPEFRDFFNNGVGKRLYDTGELDFGKNVIPSLIGCGYAVYGCVYKGLWFDIGNPETYREAIYYMLKTLSNEELNVDFSYDGIKFMGKTILSRNLQRSIIDRLQRGELKIEGDVLLGRHIFLGNGVKLLNSVIDHYTVINDETTVEDSVIMDRCFLGGKTVVVNSIIGRHVKIGNNVTIKNSIIGNNVLIGNNAVVINSKVWPNKLVSPHQIIKDSIITG